MNKPLLIFTVLLFTSLLSSAQLLHTSTQEFTRDDSLRGSITPERAWWDLTYYELRLQVQPENKFFKGSTTVHYQVLTENQRMQIDLQPPLYVTKVVEQGKEISFTKDGANAYIIQLEKKQQKGQKGHIVVFYEGHPREAKRAPWDGGVSWKKDKEGNDFIATSCQGLGASVWWPCKDHMYDEPDSMRIQVTVPAHLMNVSNGRLRKVELNPESNTRTYDWFVSNPINNYGVNINIGNFVRFSETYAGEKGKLDMDYFVLPYNLEKAKVHFLDAPKMMQAFEHWFGPYPFYEDGFKLVEVPYLGMEHQSSVTYGNQYMKGYLGRDLSGTGHGLNFDFIIIHESGHEWFANNITYKDIADMWIHESFTNYSENLFLEFYQGKQIGAEYVIGTRKNILNTSPIIGVYGVNKEGSGDMYYKGGNMLHTIRQILQDDEKWRQILRGLNKDFYHQVVTTKMVENYLIEKSGIPLQKVFDQYLRQITIPTLEWKVTKNAISYRWTTCVDGFDMPLDVLLDDKKTRIYPTKQWQKINGSQLQIVKDFYVIDKKLN
ncbi:MAG: M1 family metallopeptidase [Spirosomataceae bacterium]